MTISQIQADDGVYVVDFDFVDHAFRPRQRRAAPSQPLIPRTVAALYAEFLAMVGTMGIAVTINPSPV